MKRGSRPPSPSYAKILDAISQSSAQVLPWHGVGFRSVTPEYARSSDVVSGEGARVSGGRWNPPGLFAAVYMSLDAETAMSETLSHVRYFGLAEQDAMPRVFVAIEVSLKRVLDLTAAANLPSTLKFSARRLVEIDWRSTGTSGREPVTQMIGRAAYETGLEGVLVPSAARPGGSNMVVLPSNLLSASILRVSRSLENEGK